MNGIRVDRRRFIASGAAGAAGLALAGRASAAPGASADRLAPFATRYMEIMGAPGMIAAMADAKGLSATSAYGFADLEARRPIRPDERFHIGSISKSFCALMVLQLSDEGKVKLDADIRTYLPDLEMRAPLGPVTLHHLMCHSSGFPTAGPAPGWPDLPEQVFAPGSQFHYCNLGYIWLGRLVETMDGQSWTSALRRRVLMPLGMSETFATIGPAMRDHEVPNYTPQRIDRPYPRKGPLTRAAPLLFAAASGCVASTARDMARYVAFYARQGEGSNGRLLSPASFSAMTTSHIAAPEFGKAAGYGYGWVIETIDGEPVIRHTGGMVSFMSAMQVDLKAGVGAFASINAQQGYRPVPVTMHAVRLLRASQRKMPSPAPTPPDPDKDLKLGDYVGAYATAGGRTATVAIEAGGLTLSLDGRKLALQTLGADKFVPADPDRALFSVVFTRQTHPELAAEGAANPVVSMGWARDSFTHSGTTPPAPAFADVVPLGPEELAALEGYYISDSPWTPCVRVIARVGRLWVDGDTPFAHLGQRRFRAADVPGNPETCSFSGAASEPLVLNYGGAVLTRIGDPFMETL